MGMPSSDESATGAKIRFVPLRYTRCFSRLCTQSSDSSVHVKVLQPLILHCHLVISFYFTFLECIPFKRINQVPKREYPKSTHFLGIWVRGWYLPYEAAMTTKLEFPSHGAMALVRVYHVHQTGIVFWTITSIFGECFCNDPNRQGWRWPKTEEKQQKQEKQKKWFHDANFTSSPAGQDSWQAVAEMAIQFAVLTFTWSTSRAPYYITVIKYLYKDYISRLKQGHLAQGTQLFLLI